ncbi:uncharacterized protein LOC124677918 isoform X1 [Lolium rigidum]|uniref:uncharacterized protein LOC124677918 isoform X1 n=1 Tax=Lolium rigidum TaxID=89674 RepID=UPI001F5C4DF7|nr:uncharacterized protein LOC124677918 isoform X1 [Lolium rigidum]
MGNALIAVPLLKIQRQDDPSSAGRRPLQPTARDSASYQPSSIRQGQQTNQRLWPTSSVRTRGEEAHDLYRWTEILHIRHKRNLQEKPSGDKKGRRFACAASSQVKECWI